MTRKDFTLIAKALADTRPTILREDYLIQWEWDCKAIADALKTTNPDFDYRRFLDACGFEQ